MNYLDKDDKEEIMHIMFRTGHFSRMIPLDKVKDLINWCNINKVDVIELNIND